MRPVFIIHFAGSPIAFAAVEIQALSPTSCSDFLNEQIPGPLSIPYFQSDVYIFVILILIEFDLSFQVMEIESADGMYVYTLLFVPNWDNLSIFPVVPRIDFSVHCKEWESQWNLSLAWVFTVVISNPYLDWNSSTEESANSYRHRICILCVKSIWYFPRNRLHFYVLCFFYSLWDLLFSFWKLL